MWRPRASGTVVISRPASHRGTYLASEVGSEISERRSAMVKIKIRKLDKLETTQRRWGYV
jgi:hypothetical protein